MDRKSKQKIGYVIAIFLVFLTLMSALFLNSIRQESRLIEEQRQELEVIYPEIKTELEENFAFYQEQVAQIKWVYFWAAVVLNLLLIISLIWVYKQEKKKKEDLIKERTAGIYAQLLAFQQGKFQLLQELDEAETEECWIGIYEKLRELGHYFSDLAERLKEEENNTKALITDISHQLKIPLASIRMSHELAESEDLSVKERKEFRETEAREIQKLEILLDELVKLSRLENNMIQLNPETNSLKETIREAVGQVFMKAFEKEMELSVEMEGDIETFHDRKWTVEALANIIENAVKYSERGTNITIRVQNLPSNVLIEVEDEGMGVPEDELHQIFHRFYRGKQARENVKEGAGVGLYLARSIIEQQGGTILAKRRLEKGSVFKILLPIH